MFPCSRILLGNKKERTTDTCNYMNASQKEMKEDRHKRPYTSIHMKSLAKAKLTGRK